MTKFAIKAKGGAPATTVTTVVPKGRIKTRASVPDTVTFEGAPAFTRKAKSELFLLAIVNMVGEATFYETAESRDARFEKLVHEVTQKDPDWIARFVPYMRNTLHLRTASLVMAAEYVKAGGPNGRKVIDSAIQRADEPSVVLAYWMSKYGRSIPQPVKRGVADAVVRLYGERSLIKWDSDSLSPRFGDVIELVHPKALTPWQNDLFKFSMARRHNREDLARDTENLATIKRYRDLMALPVAERRALVEKAAESKDFSALEGAGLTWENLSGWLQGPMDAHAWESILPQMGYMAILRNLRNFDDAKISVEARNKVIAKLTDPEEVAASKQLPLRFYSAYKNVASAHYTPALETGLDLTLANVPSFAGRTLILVDISGSMDQPLSNPRARTAPGRTVTLPLRWELASLFGSAAAVRAENADLFAFSDLQWQVDFRSGGSILRTMEKFRGWVHGGTALWQSVAAKFNGHDRVIVVTDEMATVGTPPNLGSARLYVYNVAGYQMGLTSSGGNYYTFGGLSDAGFRAMEAIESLKDESWPF